MELIRGVRNLSRRRGGCVLTVGNFDGVHRGHQEIIRIVRERAASLGCASAVLSFEPTFKEYHDPEHAPARLTRWREKFVLLAAYGVDRFVTLHFDDSLRDVRPREFVRDFLHRGLDARHVVVGPDFRFGSDASGSFESLRGLGQEFGIEIERITPYRLDDVRVSSTLVRQCLASADYRGAATFLGRAYRMMGRVMPGRKLGRELGYPTANLPLLRNKSPVWGVLAVRVYGIRACAMPAVASLGTRPTVDGIEPLLEVHVFDYAGDLYGRMLEVEFVEKLRDEEKFESLDAMVRQMSIDASRARLALSRTC